MEMKVMLVDSNQKLREELLVLLRTFQCFRVVNMARDSEEAIAYAQTGDEIGRASCRERV